MHVHPCFIGDNNDSLFESQHHLYYWLCGKIFYNCRITYLRCDEVCHSLSDDEKIDLINFDSYDNRTLQYAHDVIAMSFRYLKRDNQLSLFELTEEQINIYFNLKYQKWRQGDLNYNDLIWAYHWENYFVEIIKKLSTIDTMHSDFVHHVMNAAFFNPNNKSGTESEHELIVILKEYLGLNEIFYNNHFSGFCSDR